MSSPSNLPAARHTSTLKGCLLTASLLGMSIRNASVWLNMPSLQIRDIPEDVYDALAERANRQRRSLAQQAVADLARIPELESRRTRQDVIERLRASLPLVAPDALDPVDVVREDRRR